MNKSTYHTGKRHLQSFAFNLIKTGATLFDQFQCLFIISNVRLRSGQGLQNVGVGEFLGQNNLDAIATAAQYLLAIVQWAVQIELERVGISRCHRSASGGHIDRSLEIGRRIFELLFLHQKKRWSAEFLKEEETQKHTSATMQLLIETRTVLGRFSFWKALVGSNLQNRKKIDFWLNRIASTWAFLSVKKMVVRLVT